MDVINKTKLLSHVLRDPKKLNLEHENISFNSHFATNYSVLFSDNHSELHLKYVSSAGKKNKTRHQ